MRTDAFKLTLLLWFFPSGWHSPRRIPLHRVSVSPMPFENRFFEHPPSVLHFGAPPDSVCFLWQKLELPALFDTSLLLHGPREPKIKREAPLSGHSQVPCLLAAVLWLWFPPHWALIISKCGWQSSETFKDKQSPKLSLRWAATAALKLQACMDRNECWV